MSKRRLQIAKSEEDNGEGEVKERKFAKLLKTDIKDLEIGDALKRLGNIQVMEWDFRSRKEPVGVAATKPSKKVPKRKIKAKDLQALTERLKNLLQYLVINLVDEPSKSQINGSEISPGVLRLKLVLVQRDVAMLIGREGHTAEAIRSLLKSMGKKSGVDVLLKIVSHEENNAPDQRGG